MLDSQPGGPAWVERRSDAAWSWTWKSSPRARVVWLAVALGAATWLAFVAKWTREALRERETARIHDGRLEPYDPRHRHRPPDFDFFPGGLVLPTLFAVGAAYLGLRVAFNRVEVRLDGERFVSMEGPIPARRRIRERTANIAAFEVGPRQLAHGLVRFATVLVTFDGRRVTIAERLEAERSQWLAERLNRALETLRAPLTYRG